LLICCVRRLAIDAILWLVLIDFSLLTEENLDAVALVLPLDTTDSSRLIALLLLSPGWFGLFRLQLLGLLRDDKRDEDDTDKPMDSSCSKSVIND